MNWASESARTNPKNRCLECRWMIAALFLLGAANLPAKAQQGSSLADIARQARAQKPAQPTAEGNHAQAVADELSEDQNDVGAPGGFKSYNAGDYKLWVPAPYRVEGHDDAGVVIAGPMVGMKHSIVLVGTPIVAHFGDNDDAFHDTATQFVRLYAQSANCTKTTVDNHGAYQCSLAAANLLGQVVSGNAVFVRAAGYMYPVFCVAPTDSRSRDLINNKRVDSGTKAWARESLDREEDDVNKVLQKCDTVFQSIHVREGVRPQKETADSDRAAPSAGKPAAATAAPVDSRRPPAASGNTAAPGPLAGVARQLHETPGGGFESAVQSAPVQSADPAPGSTIPDGFKVQAFNYCKGRTQCWDASVLVPKDAQLVSSDCRQYVFEVKVQGAPFLLLLGPAGTENCEGRGANDSGQVRWKQLVDPESARAPGTSSTISSQQMKLDGKPAVIIHMRFKKGLADWIGKRAEVENNGAQLVVGCMAPKETFADGDTICSGLIGSLRVP
jgi:hypothetical protein